MLFGERNENSYESMPDEVEQCQKKISNLEMVLSDRQKNNRDALQAAKRTERLYKHLVLQAEEEKKMNLRLQDQINRLQHQLKSIKLQVEDAEEIAKINLNKFKMASIKLQEAEERAVLAESEIKRLQNQQQ